MDVILSNIRALVPGRKQFHLDLRRFVAEQITRSWVLTVWLIAFTAFVGWYTIGQLSAAPGSTTTVLIIWALTVYMTVISELQKDHTPLTFWLKENMYNSINNVLVTLFLTLLILAGLRGFYSYAWVNASFETDPITSNEERPNEITVAEAIERYRVDFTNFPAGSSMEPRLVLENAAGTPIRQVTLTKSEDDPNIVIEELVDIHTGASWGSVIENLPNILLFRYRDPEIQWRIWASIGVLIVLAVPSFVVYRGERYRGTTTRRLLTWAWVASPLIIFGLLYGVTPEGPLRVVDPDQIWGGFVLTVIISVFAIVVSFPIGMLLALGRRSNIQGIPWWVTYPAAVAIMIWGLVTTTPANLEAARNTVETVLAYWPLAIPALAYLFQRSFNGNVVAAFSTGYIEVVRGTPFIVVLFMSIILFPIFLPSGWDISGVIRVLLASALFSAAYLAENIRGGLQSLPNGQYEAADSLGLSAFNKYRLIILPQALRAVIPAIVGQFIGLYKDTSLVFLVGLFDMLALANGISSQNNWLGIRTEPYILLMVIYFLGSSLMAWYSRRLERQLGVGER